VKEDIPPSSRKPNPRKVVNHNRYIFGLLYPIGGDPELPWHVVSARSFLEMYDRFPCEARLMSHTIKRAGPNALVKYKKDSSFEFPRLGAVNVSIKA
jgi:hypothetical protein